jgi:hypothetical protein
MPPQTADRGGVRPDDIEWLDLSDFRAGIIMDGGSVVNVVPGAASLGPLDVSPHTPLTYGCCADPATGMLMSLPGFDSNFTLVTTGQRPLPADLTSNLGAFTYYPSNPGACSHVIDARVIGPVWHRDKNSPHSSGSGLPTARADIVAVLFSFDYNAAGTGTNYSQYVLGRMWIGNSGSPYSATRDFYFQKSTATYAPTGSLIMPRPSGALAFTRTVAPLAAGPPFGMSQYIPILAFTSTFPDLLPQTAAAAIAVADQALTTFDTDIGATYVVGADPAAGRPASVTGIWPDATGAGVNTVGNMPYLSQSAQFLVPHQGRLVASFQFNWGVFAYSVPNVAVPLDAIGYNNTPGKIDDAIGAYTQYAPMNEEAAGVGAVASLPANSLFFVKHTGGGYLVSGDLDNPDIVRLPFVHSTGGVLSHGAHTPLGFCYLGRNGLYVYPGGDRTEHLSPQLSSLVSPSGTRTEWWDPRTVPFVERYAGAIGRLAWFDPFIICPNDWAFDTRTKSWWKLEANSSLQPPQAFFDTSPDDGSLFAFPYRQDTSTFGGTVFRRYRRNSQRVHYQWTSQAIPQMTQRVVNVCELELTYLFADSPASVTIPVTITVRSINPATNVEETSATTFQCTDKTGLVRLRKRVSVVGRDVRFTITANSAAAGHTANEGSSTVAPKLSLRVGYKTLSQIPYET